MNDAPVAGRLAGKTALVTGASRGIGRAVALRLARDGAWVMAHASGDGAEATLQSIEAAGGAGCAVSAELSTLAGVDALAREALEALRAHNGQRAPDILVNNAGIQLSPTDGVARIPEADFDRLVAINVKAPFYLVQRLLPDFPAGGRIVNLSSRLSTVGFPSQIAYAMTKAAINSFTKSLALELGPRGITVNAVGPGLIETDMTISRFFNDPKTREMVTSQSALKRTGVPEDIADIVAFLASDDSRWITGAYLPGTGGAGL